VHHCDYLNRLCLPGINNHPGIEVPEAVSAAQQFVVIMTYARRRSERVKARVEFGPDALGGFRTVVGNVENRAEIPACIGSQPKILLTLCLGRGRPSCAWSRPAPTPTGGIDTSCPTPKSAISVAASNLTASAIPPLSLRDCRIPGNPLPVLDTARQTPYIWGMEVDLTPDQTAFVQQAIEAGRLHRPEEAVRQALSMWEERERRRLEILASVEQAEASLARGEGRRITTREETTQLADDIKRRGMARLTAEQTPRG